jgi:alpha-L-fucosidase
MTTPGLPLSEQYSRLGLGAFICFNLCTFTGAEQGNPNTSPNVFNPTALNIASWVTAAKAMGAGYAHFTAKHSDGFCMWPTKTTPYNITASSPWYAANGNQDIVAEFVTAFRNAGIQPCVYYCIADATFQQSQGQTLTQFAQYNSSQLAALQANYNQAAYLAYVEAQITELLTNYGPLFAIWIDGGYWANANTYYPWPSAAAMLSFIHGLQPNIRVVNNSHAGPVGDSDIGVTEGGGENGPTTGYFGPGEFADTYQANNNWFWHGTTAFKTTASIVANYQTCNKFDASYLMTLLPDNTGAIPAGTLTELQQIGAAL